MKFLESLKRIYGVHDINWTGYSTSLNTRKDIKPLYANATREVNRRAKVLEKLRAEYKKQHRARVIEIRTKKEKAG